jgi:hypothetical protein
MTTEHGAAYRDPAYAEAFGEFGTPRSLSTSDAWLLTRTVADGGCDAMGPYPLLMCRDWSGLRTDLEAQTDLATISAVTDPFADASVAALRACFPQGVRPFKEHYIADLSQSPDVFIGAQHRRYARRALRSLDVHRTPADQFDAATFVALYEKLIERHHVRGPARFSPASLAAQLRVPGAVMFHANLGGQCVGACLWFVYDDRAYYHLAAYDEIGYALHASYALFRSAFDAFAGQVRWLCLGASAGLIDDSTDGLSQFKRGWANARRTSYLCRRIVDPERYRRLCEAAQVDHSDETFFPAYRRREWAHE